MPLRIVFQPYTLHFRMEAGTSRGVLTQKTSWILKITDEEQPGVTGYGECGPLPGLSVDDIPDFGAQLEEVCELFNQLDLEVFPFNLSIILQQVIPEHLPSVRFGIEMALLDFMNGGQKTPYKNLFSKGEKGIPMNGLIWMGSYDHMVRQIEEKLEQGYTTLKMKVGAIDFDQECRVLESVRTRFSASQITLRVDANGAFQPQDVEEKLRRLSQFELHSIEQPIRAGQLDLLADLCANSPVPVALDEELIGIFDYRKKFALLKKTQPPFIILKPTLLGGFQHCKEWIEIATRLSIGWWMTSALESNIGLNAIAQFAASFDNQLPQGLGTGALYHNNFDSPLKTENGYLFYDKSREWNIALDENAWR
ncbi:o-succinylbenzoate synthase [Dyadobacter sp. LHD-138]|uniref:o-succinylbenzoate synthase n=1 Tax=Dyadobacter sp. LHD-138 TaxID=3071413 RepID=UPI0027DF7942|nr:o-succinylbenzoate synthase [Dyadobacter sp. LHD-138]MDQ6480730.1 o-succinylbenzoate synthase [Dyadobacter sp. LHD-138]